MEIFHWVYLLSIVRPRGTSHCKVPQKVCEQTHMLSPQFQIKGKCFSQRQKEQTEILIEKKMQL